MDEKQISAKRKWAYSPENPKNKIGNAVLGFIDIRREREFKDHQVMPDDTNAIANCAPNWFQVEVKYEEDKKYDN